MEAVSGGLAGMLLFLAFLYIVYHVVRAAVRDGVAAAAGRDAEPEESGTDGSA